MLEREIMMIMSFCQYNVLKLFFSKFGHAFAAAYVKVLRALMRQCHISTTWHGMPAACHPPNNNFTNCWMETPNNSSHAYSLPHL
jgi:hypothetical protein